MRLYLVASTPYGYLHHRFQRLADGFRSLGLRVTYVEQTYGWRAYLSGSRPGFRDELRRAVRLHTRTLLKRPRPVPAKARRVPSWADENDDNPLEVIRLPLVIPTNRLNSRAVERLNAGIFLSVLEDLTCRHTENETAAIVDNPLWGAVLQRGDFTRIYYDCIDDVALYAGHASLDRFLEYERRLVACADAVFTTAAGLEERIRGLDRSKPVHRFPNGVDYDWFQREGSRRSKPEDIAGIPRPIVGYMGSIADWMDYDLVARVAAARPRVSFVFVGPTDHPRRAALLERSPNVHWLGKHPYHDVPAYIAAFDVGWIPFLGGRIVEFTNPIKLYEYFSLGKPVVTTPMPEAERYAGEQLVYTGGGTDAVIAAVDRALADGDDGRRARRLAVAREHAWPGIIRRMHAIITASP
jgi:glycosyltransferase involved in cell wall biosynthesis